MNPRDLEFVFNLVKNRSGIVLDESKVYLLESRLLPVARKNNMASLHELVEKLQKNPSETMAAEITDAMTTNETLFFRDGRPFDQLKQIILPHLAKARAGKPIRIWSAACSTGQEPYSIAITLQEESFKYPGFKYEIIGTDISPTAVSKARQGVYSQFEVQRGLPIATLMKYFAKQGEGWTIKDQIRNAVSFQNFNLLDDYSPLGQFDIIFCRNVLIYFDNETRKKILEKFRKSMAHDGFLFLGTSETIFNFSESFTLHESEKGLLRPK